MNRIEGFFKKSTATILSVLMMSSMVAVAGTATASAADTETQQSAATVNWTDGSVLTEKKGLSVKAGDLVNLWVEVTIPESDCVIEGWTTDVYYDTNVFKVNSAFADGKMFAFGNEAVDYALGLSDTAVKFPGGGAMPQGNFETDGKITLADLALGGFDFEGKTTKQLCVQLIAKSTGTGNIGYAITDLVNADLATVYVDQSTAQATDGAKFALKTQILEGQAPTEVPTEKPTEAPTEKPTEKPTEVPTEKPTEKPTDAPVSQNQIYFVPTTDWAKDNARFSAYFFDGDKESTWVSLTATSDGKHAGVIPEGNYKSVIFVRMNPATTDNNWDNGTKWNQTADLTISGNCFTLTSSQWDGGNGTWSTIGDITIPTEKPTNPSGSKGKLYFIPSNNWKNDNARFAAYFFNNTTENEWVSLTLNNDGKYECALPEKDYKQVIFVRMNPATTDNNWNTGTKWNQTADLTISGNCFTLTSSDWDLGNGTWSTVEEPTEKPTEAPTEKPTEAPTAKPTEKPTEAPTAKPTENPTETPSNQTDGYYVTGDINLKLTACGTGKVRGTIALQPGTYKFKLNDNGTLLGYNKVINDATTKGYSFKSTYGADCTLVATGGTYTFQVTLASNTLVVKYDSNLPEEYLVGDVNTILSPVAGRPLAIGTTYLEAGTYKFKISDNAVLFGNGGNCTDSTAGRSISFKNTYSSYYTLNATGGNYTFTYYTSTNKLIIKHSPVKDEALDDVHLSGEINLVLDDNNGNSDIATGTVKLAEGTYAFKVYNYGQAVTVGSKVTDKGTKKLHASYTTPLTLVASGGTYTFTFNKTTNEITIEMA